MQLFQEKREFIWQQYLLHPLIAPIIAAISGPRKLFVAALCCILLSITSRH